MYVRRDLAWVGVPLDVQRGGACEQTWLMQVTPDVASQQSDASVHLSDKPEQLGGVLEQMRAPPSPFGSQYPSQH